MSLKKFAAFLKSNYLEALAKEQISATKTIQLPILEAFSHLSDEALLKMSMESLEKSLINIEEGTTIQELEKSLEAWREKELTLQILPADLVLIAAIQRKAMMKFLPYYSKDPETIIRVMEQIEEQFTETEKLSIELLFELQNETKKALEEKEHTQEQILNNLPIGLFITNSDRSPYYVNKMGIDILGKGIDPKNKGNKLTEVYKIYKTGTSEVYPNKESPMTKALEEGKFVSIDDVEIRRGKKVIPLEVWGSPVFDDRKKVKYGITAFLDISDRKKKNAEIIELNKRLKEKVEQLKAVNSELDAFTYSVSHDLRAPLRAINGFAQIMEEDYSTSLEEECVRILGVIKYNAKKMGALIDDLLAFSRLGRKEIQKTKMNMNDLVDALLNEENKLHPDYKAEVQVDNLFPAYGDYALINQVWSNLISNAFKYSSKNKKPVVHIGCKKGENEDVYFVEDNGVGFDMKYAEKLFAVFQRLHSPDDFEGTGVGLAIVHRIIHRHKGKVWAEAKKGKGAIFYFTLPKD